VAEDGDDEQGDALASNGAGGGPTKPFITAQDIAETVALKSLRLSGSRV